MLTDADDKPDEEIAEGPAEAWNESIAVETFFSDSASFATVRGGQGG
jgi:hypothetical protein